MGLGGPAAPHWHPGGAGRLILWCGQVLFVKIISMLATGEQQAVIIAAHFVGIRVEALSYLPAFAWATAAATMVGQSLGAAFRAGRCGAGIWRPSKGRPCAWA